MGEGLERVGGAERGGDVGRWGMVVDIEYKCYVQYKSIIKRNILRASDNCVRATQLRNCSANNIYLPALIHMLYFSIF